MKKEILPREEGGGIDFEFTEEEVDKIFVDHLKEAGEDIPEEEVDVDVDVYLDGSAKVQVRGKKVD